MLVEVFADIDMLVETGTFITRLAELIDPTTVG
jgi:hypothetical protein